MRNLSVFFCKIFFWGTILLSVEVQAALSAALPASEDVSLELHADAVAVGHHIAMADVVKVVAENSRLKEMIESMHVGIAPRIGYMERYTREDLEQLVRSRLVPYAGKLVWSGAKAVKVRSASQLLPAEKLISGVREHVLGELKSRFADAELNLVAPLADLELPLGELSWKSRPIDMDHLISLLPVWIDVYVNGLQYRAVVASFSMKLRAPVYVARRDLATGTVVSRGDFEQRLEDVTDISQSVMPAAAIEVSTRMKKSMQRGQILMRDQLSPQGMVFRGDSVKVMLTEGGLTIETQAIAEQDGGIGQFVRIRPETSVAAIRGLIVAPGVVRVGGM